DPQTATLIPRLRDKGVTVIWRCHIGIDEPGPLATSAWDFLRAFVSAAHHCVFSRPSYVWQGLDPERVSVIAPCLDVLSAKNRPLDAHERDELLAEAAIFGAPGRRRTRGGRRPSARVAHPAEMLEDTPVPNDARLALQVSRWDRLKDPIGVMRGF